MKYSIQFAAFAAVASTQQFVQYTPGGDDTAVERVDPIISPGTLSGHVHQLLGANRLSPELSYASLQQSDCSTVGASDGTGNAQDKSIYWHPALYAEKKHGSGYLKIATNGHKLYYKDAGSGKAREPFEFPHDFRMIAGDPFMRAAAPLEGGRQNITQWICHSSSGDNQGTDGGFPTGMTDCDEYPGLNGAIHFPHCWNGKDFDQSDPTAHMAYPDGNIQDGECPSSHPIRLPHIFSENDFNVHDVIDQINIDTLVLAMGDNTGYGWHYDFFNGWDDGAIPELMKTCPQTNFDIGTCGSYKPFTKKAEDCKLSTTFNENVLDPGKMLPGCNPILDINPAPRLPISPLNKFTTQCKASGGNPGGSPPKAPQYSATSTQQPATTMATHTKPAQSPTTTVVAQSNPSKHRGKVSCPESHGQTIIKKGMAFEIECGVDHFAGNLETKTAHSLGECIKQCAHTEGCVDVSLSGTACYLKKELGHAVPMPGLAGAKLVGNPGGVATPTPYGNGAQKRHIHRHAHKGFTF